MISRLLWSPVGTTTPAGVSPARSVFRLPDRVLGGVARVANTGPTTQTFTIGGLGVTDTMQIPLGPGESMFIAYGPDDTRISASAAAIVITPGIARP